MAKRFTKSSIDWVALEKRVPRDQKNQFLVFKAKSDGYLRRQVIDVIADYNVVFLMYNNIVAPTTNSSKF